MTTDRYEIESTGREEYAELERNVQRALDRVRQRTERIDGEISTATSGLTDDSYAAADAADWSGTAPTTIKEALDRIAAALGPIA